MRGTVVMVGFGGMLLGHLDRFLPPDSVIVIEDPDVAVKRGVADVTEFACLAKILTARYHQDLECVDVAAAAIDAGTVQAVVPGVEYAVAGAAALADHLGLPGASPKAAAVLTDKLRLREATAAAGLRNPDWTEVHTADDVRAFAAGGPVVLKPANRHASLGVQLLAPGDDLDAAWAATVGARDYSMLPEHPLQWRYLAERLVAGHEYSVEAVVADGEVRFSNVTDKLTAAGRYPVELGHVVPASLPPGRRTRFHASMQRLVDAIGFAGGILHAEWMVDAELDPVLIECAGRVPGDSIVDLIDAAYGCRLVQEIMAVLSGRLPDLPPTAPRAAAIRFLAAAAGEVRSVRGLAEAQAAPGVVEAEVSVTAGAAVCDLRSSWDRIGQVIATGPTPAQAAERAAAAARLVEVVIA